MKNKIINKKRGKVVAIIDNILRAMHPLCKPFENRRKIELKDVKKILIVDFGYLGDTLISFPTIESIRKAYPKAKIDILINPKFKAVWKYNYDYDNLIEYEVPWIRYGFKLNLQDIKNYFKLIKKLKKERYDLAIDLRGDLRNIFLLVYKSKAPIRAGFGITGGGYLLTKDVKFPNKHEVENNLAIAQSLGGENAKYSLEIGKEEHKKIEELINDVEKEIIIILPSAGYPTKEWEIEKWIELIERLQERYEAILLGTKSDKNIPLILKHIKTKIRHYLGLNLNEVGALMTKAKYVIGSDSGGMHLASIVGAKTIELMGPTEIKRWKAYKNCTVISKHEECNPCGLYDKCNQKLKRKCMKKIKVEEVLKEIN